MHQRSYEHRIHECGGTILGGMHAGVEYSYCGRCHAFRYDDAERDDMPTGCDPERNRQAWDDGDLHSPDARPDDVPVGQVRCESGAWSGEADHHTCLREVAEEVRYVPEHLRDTAMAAGSWRGVAETITVCPSCAEHMAEHDPDWVRPA